MKHDEMAAHFVGILLVLAMLSCAAALNAPAASDAETFAFEDNAAPDASPSSPPLALSP